MSNIFPDDVKEAADKIGGDWIKAGEFEGNGLVLKIAKPMEKVRATNPKYGAQEADYLVKNELLEVGETFRFTFETADGSERKIDTKSTPFFIAFKQCADKEVGVGDWVLIQRTGKTDETRYTVEKVDEPTLTAKVPEAVKKGDIPF